jgi:hypothetical protein
MKLKSAFEEHAPLLFVGILCWLCGAVLIGVAAAWLVNATAGVFAAGLLTLLILIVFWRMGSLATIRTNEGGKQ